MAKENSKCEQWKVISSCSYETSQTETNILLIIGRVWIEHKIILVSFVLCTVNGNTSTFRNFYTDRKFIILKDIVDGQSTTDIGHHERNPSLR